MSFKHGLGAINQKNQAVFIAPMALIDKLYKVNCTCTCIYSIQVSYSIS